MHTLHALQAGPAAPWHLATAHQPCLCLCLCTRHAQNGDVHINVAAVNLVLGLQVQALSVFPQSIVPSAPTVRCAARALRARWG